MWNELTKLIVAFHNFARRHKVGVAFGRSVTTPYDAMETEGRIFLAFCSLYLHFGILYNGEFQALEFMYKQHSLVHTHIQLTIRIPNKKAEGQLDWSHFTTKLPSKTSY